MKPKAAWGHADMQPKAMQSFSLKPSSDAVWSHAVLQCKDVQIYRANPRPWYSLSCVCLMREGPHWPGSQAPCFTKSIKKRQGDLWNPCSGTTVRWVLRARDSCKGSVWLSSLFKAELSHGCLKHLQYKGWKGDSKTCRTGSKHTACTYILTSQCVEQGITVTTPGLEDPFLLGPHHESYCNSLCCKMLSINRPPMGSGARVCAWDAQAEEWHHSGGLVGGLWFWIALASRCMVPVVGSGVAFEVRSTHKMVTTYQIISILWTSLLITPRVQFCVA
jgi:hypothetical protein